LFKSTLIQVATTTLPFTLSDSTELMGNRVVSVDDSLGLNISGTEVVRLMEVNRWDSKGETPEGECKYQSGW
jgi:hypothetical protein